MKAFGVGWILCALLLAGGMLFFYTPALADSHRPMLPDVYHEQDISGWWMSEKLDGVRGYWDGEQLWSKNGHLLFPPDEFTDGFPPFPLEGELWKGRNSFEQTASIVQREEPHRGWMGLKFAVFDAPATGKTFRQRLARIKGWLKKNPAGMLIVIEQVPVQDLQHLQSELTRIEALGGEGLIVRDPDALYNAGRSTGILKVKSFQDAEATVIAHLPGKGKHKGRLGALLVEQDNGLRFRIGTGFSDFERSNPPEPGTVISYKYYGRYRSGLPKFPAYLRVRKDSRL